MAETRLSDIIEPSVFNPYVMEQTKEISALFDSEIIAAHPDISKHAKMGGKFINVPFWNDLSSTESNVGTDDPASDSTPLALDAGKDVSAQHFRNQSWSAMDLSAAIAGDDPMKRVGDAVARYWARDYQRTLISSLSGVIADNVANDSGDMVVDVATDDAGAIVDAELISASAIIDSAQTMGDAKNDLVAIAMHSAVHSRLQKLNLIQFTEDSEGNIRFPTYLGYRVIVDDGCPAVSGTNRITYTSYLFGRGALAWGEGQPKTPHEVDRKPESGDGEGQETLFSRNHFVLHPRGISFNDQASLAATSPSNTELALAANWDRVLERKQVRLAALKTNG
jgi:hypothetical protein